MNQNTERINQFKAEVADMRLRDPATGADRLQLRLGLAGMGVGVAVAVIAYFLSHGTTNSLQQRDAIVQALIGLTVAVVGAALFLKAALANFLRFWLARLIYEQQAQTDRLVGPVDAASDNSSSSSLPTTGVLRG